VNRHLISAADLSREDALLVLRRAGEDGVEVLLDLLVAAPTVEERRGIFMALTAGALVILGRLYKATRQGDFLRTIALGLVCGGAVGNLIDRVRSATGVVDFIDVGVGDLRWPTFNVADMAVSVGAFMLAWVLWGEERSSPPVVATAPVSDTPAES